MQLEIIFSDDFSELKINKDLGILYFLRKYNSDWSDETYKSVVLKYVESAAKYKPTFALINTKDMNFIITDELRLWLNENIFNLLQKTEIIKTAYVVGDNIFTLASIELSHEENTAGKSVLQYFTNEEDAFNWLLNNN